MVYTELELELIQTQMTQELMLRAEVYARALRASQNRKEDSGIYHRNYNLQNKSDWADCPFA